MKSLLTSLPPEKAVDLERREHPAFKENNAVVGGEVLKNTAGHNPPTNPTSSNPVFKTTMEFRDDFDPEPADPSLKNHRLRNIFTDDDGPAIPNISIDPNRNRSTVFQEGEQGGNIGRSNVGGMDPNRFTSHIFDAEPEACNAKSSRPATKDRFESSIFGSQQTEQPQCRRPIPPQLRSDFFSRGQNPEDQHESQLKIDTHRFASTFDWTDPNSMTNAPQNVYCRSVDPSANRSTLPFASIDDSDAPEHDKVMQQRTHKTNQSSIRFDFDNPQQSPAKPSTRVLKPPGGESHLVL